MIIARRFNTEWVVEKIKVPQGRPAFQPSLRDLIFCGFIPALKCRAIIRGSFGSGLRHDADAPEIGGGGVSVFVQQPYNEGYCTITR